MIQPLRSIHRSGRDRRFPGAIIPPHQLLQRFGR